MFGYVLRQRLYVQNLAIGFLGMFPMYGKVSADSKRETRLARPTKSFIPDRWLQRLGVCKSIIFDCTIY